MRSPSKAGLYFDVHDVPCALCNNIWVVKIKWLNNCKKRTKVQGRIAYLYGRFALSRFLDIIIIQRHLLYPRYTLKCHRLLASVHNPQVNVAGHLMFPENLLAALGESNPVRISHFRGRCQIVTAACAFCPAHFFLLPRSKSRDKTAGGPSINTHVTKAIVGPTRRTINPPYTHSFVFATALSWKYVNS